MSNTPPETMVDVGDVTPCLGPFGTPSICGAWDQKLVDDGKEGHPLNKCKGVLRVYEPPIKNNKPDLPSIHNNYCHLL
jgi:hypothetical protein